MDGRNFHSILPCIMRHWVLKLSDEINGRIVWKFHALHEISSHLWMAKSTNGVQHRYSIRGYRGQDYTRLDVQV